MEKRTMHNVAWSLRKLLRDNLMYVSDVFSNSCGNTTTSMMEQCMVAIWTCDCPSIKISLHICPPNSKLDIPYKLMYQVAYFFPHFVGSISIWTILALLAKASSFSVTRPSKRTPSASKNCFIERIIFIKSSTHNNHLKWYFIWTIIALATKIPISTTNRQSSSLAFKQPPPIYIIGFIYTYESKTYSKLEMFIGFGNLEMLDWQQNKLSTSNKYQNTKFSKLTKLLKT